MVPEGVTALPVSIFEYANSLRTIHLPSTLRTIGDYAMSGCGNLHDIDFPAGITSIGNYAFNDCGYLRIAVLPDTLVSLGTGAFQNCSRLAYVTLPNEINYVGKNAFNGCNVDLTFYASSFSNGLIYAIDNGLKVIPNNGSNLMSDIFDSTGTVYYGDLSSVHMNGCISCVLKYCLTDSAYSEMTDKKLVLSVPAGTELLESTLNINGNMLQNYSMDGNRLIIPLSGQEITLHFVLRLTASVKRIQSYAKMEYKLNNQKLWRCIGLIDERLSVLTLNCPDTVSEAIIPVNGTAEMGTRITLMVDGTEQKQIVAENGMFSAELEIPNPVSGRAYTVSASGTDNGGNTLGVSAKVIYLESAPAVASFKMYYNNHANTYLDLLTDEEELSTVFFNPAHPLSFTLQIDNDQNIDKVYVTSTRSNIKYSMEAKYDPARGLYVATGYFNPNQKYYVPGTIGVDFVMKHQDAPVSESFDLSGFGSQGTNYGTVQAEGNTVTSEIDLGGIVSGMNGVILKTSLKTIDLEAGTNLSDLKGYFDTSKTVFSYILPGLDDKKYLANIDFSDPGNILMIVADGTETADTVYELVLDCKDLTDADYNKFFDTSTNLSNAATVTGTLYKMYGIQDDYNDLVREINQSTTISNKTEALKKAEELRNDQMAFLLLTVSMPLLVAGGPMAGPAIAFSALLGMMKVTSDVFFDLRVAEIKGKNVKLAWCLDPSGYVYEAVTSNRVSGVEASAWWVPYDENNLNFWDSAPGEGAGILWDAAPWQQVNPLYTDHEGRYKWDVPEGWWQVRFNKEGYLPATSQWLSVAPPQTEINIPLISTEDPVWTTIVPHENGVALYASRYLIPDSVSSVKLLDQNGNELGYTLSYPQDETAADGTVYARHYTLTTVQKTFVPGERMIVCTPDHAVYSYADVPMTANNRTVVFAGEKSISVQESLKLEQNSSFSLKVKINNPDGSEELEVLSENKDIVHADSIGHVDGNGEAEISIISNFAGTTVLTVQISGTDISRSIRVTVGYPSYEEAFGSDKSILRLPNLLTEIEEEAFYANSQIEAVILPQGIRSIGKKAFANCTNLKAVWIPEGVEVISDNVFSGSAKTIIYCEENSSAAVWANQHGIPTVFISN